MLQNVHWYDYLTILLNVHASYSHGIKPYCKLYTTSYYAHYLEILITTLIGRHRQKQITRRINSWSHFLINMKPTSGHRQHVSHLTHIDKQPIAHIQYGMFNLAKVLLNGVPNYLWFYSSTETKRKHNVKLKKYVTYIKTYDSLCHVISSCFSSC